MSVKQMSVKEAVRERDAHRCVDCGAVEVRGITPGLQVHRIVPGRDGGAYTLDNCVLLCEPCHCKRHGWKFWDVPYEYCCPEHPFVLSSRREEVHR